MIFFSIGTQRKSKRKEICTTSNDNGDDGDGGDDGGHDNDGDDDDDDDDDNGNDDIWLSDNRTPISFTTPDSSAQKSQKVP